MGNTRSRHRPSSQKNNSNTVLNSSISNTKINEIGNLGVSIDTPTLANVCNANANAIVNELNLTPVASSSSKSASAANNSNIKAKGSNSLLPRTNKVTIPYERWIKCDCKKWGHFKDFDFYNLTSVNPATVFSSYGISSTSTSTNSGNIIIAIDKKDNNSNSQNKLTNNSLTLASCDLASSPTNLTSNTSSSISNSYFISANLNQYLTNSFCNNNSNNSNTNQTILSLDGKTNANNCFLNAANSNLNINYGPLHYINGSFFKPIERLGDSQFIISQWPLNDIIVTVPCNIERYKANDKSAKDTAAKLNRVIGVCEQFVVFQIWKGNNEVEIFIYEYIKSTTNGNNLATKVDTMIQSSSNRIVRKLNKRFNSRTYTCLISPDRNFLLITPDYEINFSYSHHTHSHAESTVIINLNTFELLHVQPAKFDSRFAFDPRYAMPNYSAPRFAEFDTVRGQIFDLSMQKCIVCSNHTLKTKVFRVEYTKDGYLIIVVCTLPVFHRRARRNYFIYILNSSSLLHMRSIIDYRGPLLSTYMFSNDFNLLFNMYPSISSCASSIAVLKNIEPSLNTRVIELYSLPNVCSMSLKELCRRVILRYVDSKHLNRLPLPPKLISYLSFNNCSISHLNNKLIYSSNTANSSFHLLNNNNGNNGNCSRRELMLNNMKRNLSNKCTSLTSRINLNKKSIVNLLQTRNSSH